MLHIVTDGAADLPASWEEEYDIQIVPIKIHADLSIDLDPGAVGLVLYPTE